MAEESIITYDKLYDTLRVEKYKKEIQKLDSDFNTKVVKYLEEKESILKSQENKDSVFASQGIAKTKRQLENARAILKELYERREGKLIQLALFNSRTDQALQETSYLLQEEIKFYNELVSLFNLYKESVLNNLLKGILPEVPKHHIFDNQVLLKERSVQFLQPVPEFLGEDMNAYGPFQPEDTARLPMKVSEVLIKNGMAKQL